MPEIELALEVFADALDGPEGDDLEAARQSSGTGDIHAGAKVSPSGKPPSGN